jgi:hypothetical protein
MGTDGQAFNKVKNLLNRMDRSIDEARDKRLGRGTSDGPLIGAAAPAPSASNPTIGGPAVATRPSASQTIGAGPAPSHNGNGAYPSPRPAPASNSHTPSPIGLGAPNAETSKSGYGRAKPLSRPNDSQPENARRWGA